MLLGFCMLAPLFLALGGWRDLARLSPRGTGAVLSLGLGSSGPGYLFWCGTLEKVAAAKVAALLYFEPKVTLARSAPPRRALGGRHPRGRDPRPGGASPWWRRPPEERGLAEAQRAATTSISTRAPFGRPATATVERAGGLWPKRFP